MIDSSKPNTADKYGCKFDPDIDACSTTECTGLMHAAPVDDAEAEHYNQVFQFLTEAKAKPHK